MTIEERAEQSSIEQLGRLSPAFECGYIQCEQDQKQIDIEKACEWIRNNAVIGLIEEEVDDFINEFKKAMEE